MSFIYIWSFFILHLLFLALIDNKWLWIVFILIIFLITITIIMTKINQSFSLFTAYRVFQKHTNSKVKSQQLFVFFAAVNHLSGLLRKQNFTQTGSKGHGLWSVIGGSLDPFCVLVFQGSLLVILLVIMIDCKTVGVFSSKSERNRQSVAYRSLTHP